MVTHRIIVRRYDLDKLYHSLTHGGEIHVQNLDVIKEITVVDPYTVQITLKAYDPVFLLRMVGYQHGYIVSKKAAEQFGDQFGWNPVGTGPFYFDKNLPREKIIFKANDYNYPEMLKILD